MPDHVHFFARPAIEAKPLSGLDQSWKSLSSRQLIAECQSPPPVRQADYFDHFVRVAAAYQAQGQYVQENPVRKGLSRDRAAWPFQGSLLDLKFAQAG
ncbi:MAG: hypothetical protein ACOZE5_15985 [Verrucomicrobiota bacterium]